MYNIKWDHTISERKQIQTTCWFIKKQTDSYVESVQ